MVFNDWPLVIFSILAQLAVGTFVILGVVRLMTDSERRETAFFRLLNRGWIGSFVVVSIALLISLLHLGSPLNAPLTVLNLGSAWLSREVLFGLLFALFAGLMALFQWRQISTQSIRDLLYGLGTVSGLGLIFSMSMIYRYVETQPAWNTPYTTVMFFLTAGVLGSLTVIVLMITNALFLKEDLKEAWYGRFLQGTIMTSLILIGLDVLVYFFYVLGLFNGIPEAQATAQLLTNQFSILFVLRILFVLLGAVLGGLHLTRLMKTEKAKNLMVATIFAAFLLVLTSELISRFLFYAANVRIGI
ncbi:MAG: DmsC/YnfH family molybdoenzyme membrane anchor subunit [Anaerolineales bacterium]|nr:DmsC/YnfH family molybdoenzyme membrane anchor subunit [Anaerolineales bacterium]